ncbi:MAG TPA: ATP-dependent DNA helicase RecG [Candidatus Acidoferrum sp.]|nr:ATP-dependent DNA helicase RecG [Candidatus Acidoferrum sp.]
MDLNQPIKAAKGIGPAIVEKLASLGVATIGDLLYFFPRRYEDFSHVTPIAKIVPGKVTLKAQVESVVGRYVRRGLHIIEAVIDDGTDKTRAVWYNQPYRATQLKKGETFYFSGEYEMQRNRYVLSNPATEREADFSVSTGRIVPIYPETKNLKSVQIRRAMRELLPLMQVLPETLPAKLIKRYKLTSINDALRQLHFPESTEQLEAARHRLAFEELLEIMLANALNKQGSAALNGYSIAFQQPRAEQFVASLPFAMTAAQKRAAWEILQDIATGTPMNRLLQGDVGSGKTVVAAMAMFMAVQAGYQAALMAPTEILAMQHAETLSKHLEPLGLRLALLTSAVKPAARELLQQYIASGEVDIVIGTHALLQKDSQFAKLGLVVIDEQHRFGVEQRGLLLKKGDVMPHLLSMSATPIPRSLQLTLYGELNISVIGELPKGRQAIVTKLVSPFQRKSIYEFAEQQIEQGRQVYVVCPMIGDDPKSELKNVEAEYANLKASTYAHRRVAMLHGQLKSEEKEAVMQKFKVGETDVLVTTTVIEVGVDVPNASVMIIEGAERFGLAQLHQLRGRIGRGQHQSYCFLIPTTAKNPSERLLELENSQDGFYLAEVDLRLRGPGEIYGRMQHGALNLRIASLGDTKLIKQVQQAAEWLLDSKLDLLQYKQLSENVNKYRQLTSLN